jgi:hypothetical protein
MNAIKKLLPFLAVLALLAGCKTFTVAPGADPLVVYAEASAETALDTFDAFLKWERANEAALSEWPQIHATADEIRRNGKQWIRDLRTATKVYKSAKTSENRDALLIAQELLDFAVQEARQRFAEGGRV